MSTWACSQMRCRQVYRVAAFRGGLRPARHIVAIADGSSWACLASMSATHVLHQKKWSGTLRWRLPAPHPELAAAPHPVLAASPPPAAPPHVAPLICPPRSPTIGSCTSTCSATSIFRQRQFTSQTAWCRWQMCQSALFAAACMALPACSTMGALQHKCARSRWPWPPCVALWVCCI